MRSRKLVLKKESLTELTQRELGGVAGGDAITPQCPSHHCWPTWDVLCRVSDMMADCPSLRYC